MTDIKELQLRVEKWFKEQNKPYPVTWSWEKNEKGLFYVEPTTKKKRYGVVKPCKFCKREFIARNAWDDSITVCSKLCGGLLKENKVTIPCAWCNAPITKVKSKLKNSKHGLSFCNRKCKEDAQSIGGIQEIQPDHYGDGSASYSKRAFKHYGYKCIDCNITMKNFLQVHHIDSDRENGNLDNLEVVCNIHHMLRHMTKENNKWVVDFKCLTPRDKLDELRKLLTA